MFGGCVKHSKISASSIQVESSTSTAIAEADDKKADVPKILGIIKIKLSVKLPR